MSTPMANINPDTGQAIVPPTPSMTPVPTVPVPTAQTVYSAPNVTQAVTAPAPAPNLSDPYGLYNQFMSTPEILAAQQAVAQGQQQINQTQQGLRTTTRALEGQNVNALGGTGASVNLIGRQVGRARELTADELAGLGETQQAALANLATLKETGAQRYQIAQQERAQLQDLIRQTSGKAGISFADSFETALKKADNYQKAEEKRIQKEADERAKQEKKDAYKAELKSTALQLGIKTSGKSTKELEKSLKKYYKSEKEYKDQIKALELASKKKTVSGSGSTSVLQKVADVWTQSGGNWQAAADKLASQGVDVGPGSVADNEMRRRAGLAPISKSGGASSEAQKLMNELGVSESVAEAMIKQEMGL